MQSKATTVAQYLKELPPDRRDAVQAIRDVFLRNLDKTFEEGMQYGMIGYFVPHRVFPAGYHCDPKQPLPFAGLASQKNHISLYLLFLYYGLEDEKAFRAAWEKTGKKLDIGKSCIRLKKLEDAALDVIAESLRRVTAKAFIERYQQLLSERGDATTGGKKAAARKKAPTRNSPPKTSTRRSSGDVASANKETGRKVSLAKPRAGRTGSTARKKP